MNRKDRRAAGKQARSFGVPGGEPLFARAVAQHQSGQLAEAENLYRKVLAAERNHFGSLYYLGVIALQRGQPQAAIEPLGRALAVDDGSHDCHYNLAFALQTLGRLPEAAAHYRRAT